MHPPPLRCRGSRWSERPQEQALILYQRDGTWALLCVCGEGEKRLAHEIFSIRKSPPHFRDGKRLFIFGGRINRNFFFANLLKSPFFLQQTKFYPISNTAKPVHNVLKAVSITLLFETFDFGFWKLKRPFIEIFYGKEVTGLERHTYYIIMINILLTIYVY